MIMKNLKVKPEQIDNFLMAFINDHWEAHYYVDHEVYKYVYLHFPEFRYEGIGFRAVINNELDYSPNRNLLPFTCWTKTQLGMIHFINHEIEDQAFFDGDECFTLTGDIKGIDIYKIAKYLFSKNILNEKQLSMFEKEDEVVNLIQIKSANQKKYELDSIQKNIKLLIFS